MFLRRKARVPFAFLVVRATCLDQASLFVMFTPRYRALDTSCRIWPLMVYILVSGFPFRHILIDSHFLALNFISHLLLHSTRESRSRCSASWSLALWIGRYKRQSSANIRTLEVTFSGRSLLCRKNKSGPMTVPSGTPETTCAGSDFAPSPSTHWLLCFRKFEIQLWICPLIP